MKLHGRVDISIPTSSIPLVISRRRCASKTHANQQYEWAANQENSYSFNMHRIASQWIIDTLRWMLRLLPNPSWRRLVMNN